MHSRQIQSLFQCNHVLIEPRGGIARRTSGFRMDALLASRSFHRAARCAGCAVVLAMLIPGAGHAQQRCEPPAARLVSLQGTVELQLAGTNVWTPATLGQALCLGDALRVGRASRAALALANDFDLAPRRAHDAAAARRRRGTALADRSDPGRRLLLQPSPARARGRHAVRQRRRGGHRVPGAGRRRARRGGDARRPGAAAQSAGRAAGRERRCRADPGGARRRSRWWWRGRAMPWPGRCTIRRS